jgi:hypothetical protein
LHLVQASAAMKTFLSQPRQKWDSRARLGDESLGPRWGLPEWVLLVTLTTDDDDDDKLTALAARGAEGSYLGIRLLELAER